MTAHRCTEPPCGIAAEAAARHRAVLPALETPRLRLRAPRLEDLSLWTDILIGPDSAYLGDASTAEHAWEEFCVYVAGWMLHGHGLWAVERRSDRCLIGFVLLGLEWGDAEPELGYLLAPEVRGRGYGHEAAKAARDHGVRLLGSFVSYVDPDNAASNALAAKLGATRDAGAEDEMGGYVHVWRYGAQAWR